MSTSATRIVFLLAAAFIGATALAWAPSVSSWQPEETSESPTGRPEDAPPGDATSEDDPEVDRIIEDLERAAERAADARLAPSAPVAAPASANLVSEGTFLRSRRGRVVRSDAGEWVFRFDSDGESPITDPPMVLMPCQALMAMEAIAQRHGDAATFTVSGTVYVYHNRNYLLPAFYVVNRATDEVMPAQ